MGKKDLYTIRTYNTQDPEVTSSQNEMFVCSKLDEDFNPTGEYYLTDMGESGIILCTCFAGTKPTCRHRQMLRLFQAEEKVDSGDFYNFDKKSWIRGIGRGEESKTDV